MKTEIWVSYNYGGWSLVFAKTFDLPFVPFYGLTIEDDNGEIEIDLNSEEANLSYNTNTGLFFVNIHKRWRHPIDDWEIDEHIKNYSDAGWERKDTTNIAELKELMERERSKLKP